jgi:hypothetical protein
MRVLASRTLSLVAPIALLLALVYSQVGWRNDQKAYADLREKFGVIRLERTFPSDGEDLAASSLRVIRGADTVPLIDVVHGRNAVIYFDRPECPTCAWFAAKMDSILPAWRDSLVVVTSYSEKRGPVLGLTLDSASSAIMTGVPAMLVVDSAGFVKHSVPAGLPQVTQVLDFMGIPSPGQLLLKGYADSTHAARTASAGAVSPDSAARAR